MKKQLLFALYLWIGMLGSTWAQESNLNKLTVVDGVYQISSGEELNIFAAAVNTGQTTLNAQLTNDIDMTSANAGFPIIGKTLECNYQGTFDGQGHKICNLQVESGDDYIGMFGFLGDGALLKNFTLDKNCLIKGNAFVGIVGGTNSNSTITLFGIGNEGTVKSGAQNAGAIIGCNMSSLSHWTLENCFATGTIEGGYESGALSGWIGSNVSTVKNCYSTATVMGHDGTNLFIRGAAQTMTNCWDINGCSGTSLIASADMALTGELCFNMNYGLEKPIWYQTIGVDDHPVLDDTHGVVFNLGGQYMDAHDAESLKACIEGTQAFGKAFCEMTVAQKSMKDELLAGLELMSGCTTVEEALAFYTAGLQALAAIEANASAYTVYLKKIESIQTYLNEHPDLEGEAMDLLTEYLTSDNEPSETLPNGSYKYITENCLLTTEEITAEAQFAQNLLDTAILSDIKPGADVTSLMKNADFKNDFEGWSGTLGSGMAVSPTQDIVGVEAWNKSFNMYQDLTDLENGIYLLSMTGAFRPGHPSVSSGGLMSNNYSGGMYLNNNVVFFPSVLETMLPVEEAVDGVNCNLTNDASDYEVMDEFGEKVIGYAIHGQISIANAAAAGRAMNYMVANVTDGTLRVGIVSQGTGLSYDWTGFANMHLFYLGTLAEADEKLDLVLKGQIARANTLLNFKPSTGEDYAQFPNFSKTLQDALRKEIADAEEAVSPEDKYTIITEFSQTFSQIVPSKKEFINAIKTMEELSTIANGLAPNNIDEEIYNEIMQLDEQTWKDYTEGTIDLEALQQKSAEYKEKILIPLITSAGQLSSNASDRDEGQHIEYLIDGNVDTYWHSDWHGECQDDYHWIQVEFPSPYSGSITPSFVRRNWVSPDHPTKMYVVYSEDGEGYTEVGDITFPLGTNIGTVYGESFFVNNARYIRFYVTETQSMTDGTGFRKFWHAAEFQLYGKETLGTVLLDVNFNEDGTATDSSPYAQEIKAIGTPSISYDEELGMNVWSLQGNKWGEDPVTAFFTEMKDIIWGQMVDGYTMECYVRPTWDGDEVPSTWCSVLGYQQQGGPGMIVDSKQWTFEVNFDGTYQETYSGAPIKDEWVHLVGVYNKNEGKLMLYVNGNLTASTDVEGTMTAPNAEIKNLFMGCDLDGATGEGEHAFQGDIAKIRLFCMPLSAGEIVTLYQSTPIRAYKEALITDVSQLSSNASDKAEGLHLEYLIDGNLDTFWHSDWHKECKDDYHWMQVDLGDLYTGNISLEMVRRNHDANHPTEIIVSGSVDGEEFTDITTINLPLTGRSTTAWGGPFFVDGYQYLRFTVTNCNALDDTAKFSKYWHAAEFQLWGKKSCFSGIVEVTDSEGKKVDAEGIFNLMGQKVQKIQKGIYILNGRKVLVK